MKQEFNELEKLLIKTMHSEHCGYCHSKKLLKELPKFDYKYEGENAGVIEIGKHSIVFKIESHNHPCAVEPYNGAATGVGGIVRDVLAMNARPIALLDSFKFGLNKHIENGVIKGVSHYANSIGVPTIAGELDINEAYNFNPLVNVCALGIVKTSQIITSKSVSDKLVVLLGSLTRKDGLGGANFASKNLEEKSDQLAIQIADPFMKKKLIEATLEILKPGIACQDLGAAGLLSSTSETANKSGLGIEIDLNRVKLGDKTLNYGEIMLSETQERMLFVLKRKDYSRLIKIAQKYELDYCLIGKTTNKGHYVLKDKDRVLADIAVSHLCDAPTMPLNPIKGPPLSLKPSIKKDRRYIYNQYDWSVGTRTLKEPDNSGFNALWIYEENALLGLQILSDFVECSKDPYKGAYDLVEKAYLSLIEKGYKPLGITNCLNFANPKSPEIAYEFEQTIFALRDACLKYKIPVVSGNVSFYNQHAGVPIPPTPVVVMAGVKMLDQNVL